MLFHGRVIRPSSGEKVYYINYKNRNYCGVILLQSSQPKCDKICKNFRGKLVSVKSNTSVIYYIKIVVSHGAFCSMKNCKMLS